MRYLPLLLPCLLLSACSTQQAQPTTPSLPDPQKVTVGTVKDWKGEQATVSLVVGGQELSSAAVDTKGQFTLPLPEASKLAGKGVPAGIFPDFAEGCVNNQQVSDSSARLVAIHELQLKDNSGTKSLSSATKSHTMSLDASTLNQNWLVYAASATQIYGDVICEKPSLRGTYSFLLELQPGWNMVQLKQTVTAGKILKSTTQFTTVPLTAQSSWQVGSVQPLSLP